MFPLRFGAQHRWAVVLDNQSVVRVVHIFGDVPLYDAAPLYREIAVVAGAVERVVLDVRWCKLAPAIASALSGGLEGLRTALERREIISAVDAASRPAC
jgi:hypothetical protein